MQFHIVDAFADQIFGGNPAGIVLIPDGQDFPTEDTMRKTAAELRYSETAFVKRLDDKRFQTRYFTPAAEVELCGHATIAAFHTLRTIGSISAGNTYLNQTCSGLLEVAVSRDTILMDMAKPQLFEAIEPGPRQEELYRIMGLNATGQGSVRGYSGVSLTPRKASTGLTDIMLPVADEDELSKIEPDFAALTELSRRYSVVGVHAFTCNTRDGLIHTRNFAPLYEIDEEAATGTSNGALIYYLYDNEIVKCNTVYTIIQGEKMGRPSKISAQVILAGNVPSVRVGGPAITLAQGEIHI